MIEQISDLQNYELYKFLSIEWKFSKNKIYIFFLVRKRNII